MASSGTLPRAYYSSANPSILDYDAYGLDDEDEGNTVFSTSAQEPKEVSGTWQDHRATQAQTAAPVFRYQPPDPSIFGGFGEDEPPQHPVQPPQDSTLLPDPGRGKTVSLAPETPSGNSLDGSLEQHEANRRQANGASSATGDANLDSCHDTNFQALFGSQAKSSVTLAYFRNQEHITPAELQKEAANDFGFGQRYRLAGESSSIVVTNKRVAANPSEQARECVICTDTKPSAEFPEVSITTACTHAPTTCLECVAMSIKSDLNSRLWNSIRCPECRETLQYEDVQKFADEKTRDRYQTLSFRYAVSEADNFIWCTAGCGYGQVHDGGSEQPIVTCLLCNFRSCFHHKAAWHENLTCDEFDELLRDPDNFRSRFDLENEEAEQALEARRAQEDADRIFAQGLLAEEERAEANARMEKEAKIRRAQEHRAMRERNERLRKAEETRRAAARRKVEEDQSKQTIRKTTKPCPGCGWGIEKNQGCSHMTCIKCRHEFCWGCNMTWSATHSIHCGTIRRRL